jgi:hypothetical protein
MKIHRYIYTRLPKAASPWGKEGFQSAFLPHDLLQRSEVMQIESCIHFPENLGDKVKSAVFYLKGAKQTFLTVLFLVAQPEEKDDHGRGGIFLCEGFLIEEKDWHGIRDLGSLWLRLREQRIGSLPNVMAATGIDFKAGTIDAIERDWAENGSPHPASPAIDAHLLAAVYNLLNGKFKDLSIVLKGRPEEVSQKIAPIGRLLPDALRPRLGWDDAFDGGKIFFSPLKLFGYQDNVPVTGKPVRFDPESGELPLMEPDQVGAAEPSDPFSRWLAAVQQDIQPQPKLNALYALSEAMVAGVSAAPEMESDPLFEELNAETISELFAKGISALAGADWLPYFEVLIPNAGRLSIWMKGFQVTHLAELLEQVILQSDLSPAKVKTPPAPTLVAAGSPALKALATHWTKEVPSIETMQMIPEQRRSEVLAAMIKHGDHRRLAYEPLLIQYHTQLPELTKDVAVALNLRPYLDAKIPEVFDVVRGGLVTMVIEQGDFRALIGEEIDWLKVFDNWLVTHGGDIDAWREAKQLGKATDLTAYPHLEIFANGKGEFPRRLRDSQEGRRGYLEALMRVHGYKAKDLQAIGFGQDEIDAASEKGGFFGKLKRLFGG